MNCDHTRDLLSAYFDDEVEGVQRNAIRGHLAGCDVCRNRLALLQQVSDSFDASRKASPPLDLWDRIESRVRREMTPSVPAGRRAAGRGAPTLMRIMSERLVAAAIGVGLFLGAAMSLEAFPGPASTPSSSGQGPASSTLASFLSQTGQYLAGRAQPISSPATAAVLPELHFLENLASHETDR